MWLSVTRRHAMRASFESVSCSFASKNTATVFTDDVAVTLWPSTMKSAAPTSYSAATVESSTRARWIRVELPVGVEVGRRRLARGAPSDSAQDAM